MSWAEFAKLIFQVARANEEKYDLHIKIQKIEPVLSSLSTENLFAIVLNPLKMK